MPRFYFDTDDDHQHHRDHDGCELPDDEAARRHGLAALPDMARDEIPDGDRRAFTIVIRNSDKQAIYTADLTLTGKWLS